MSSKIRMADIAEKLGISIVSVSKALSGKDGVSEETRMRILSTAKQMGYVSPSDKRKKEKRSGNIGIIVADRFFSDNAFYSNLFRTMLIKSTAAGYPALLEIVSSDDERSCNLPRMLLEKKVDGLVFMGEISRTYYRAATHSGIPAVMLDFFDDSIGENSVISDNVSGAYRLTRHLLDTGRRNIGFVGNICYTSSIMDRYLGYVKALRLAGITPRDDWQINDRDLEGRYIPLKLPEEMPEAFVCNCDEVAYNLVEKLKREGYDVPRRVAVTGYDDYMFSQVCDPPLTTYRVDVESMASSVVVTLIRKIRGKSTLNNNIVIKGCFVRRKST